MGGRIGKVISWEGDSEIQYPKFFVEIFGESLELVTVVTFYYFEGFAFAFCFPEWPTFLKGFILQRRPDGRMSPSKLESF